MRSEITFSCSAASVIGEDFNNPPDPIASDQSVIAAMVKTEIFLYSAFIERGVMK